MENEKSNVIHKWYDEVWNNSNGDAISELMHHEVKAFGLGPEVITGRESFIEFYSAFNNTYSDIHITVDKTLVDGDYVTAMCTVDAVHRETNKPVKFIGVSITVIQNGQITSGWNYFDFLTLNLQIGKIKPEQLD